mmetsp:Transcript_149158/g.362249  ORF Transcript_149158/g.362249 Transcript_149158/m.362249 type:complete len:149 (-) Transcript_149158:190-636(-)
MVHDELKNFFKPEFLNRLDEIVVFRSLTREDVQSIAEVEFKKVLKRLQEQDWVVQLTDRFKEQVIEEGYDPAYGARPLRRAITRLLEDTLAETLLAEAEEASAESGEQREATPGPAAECQQRKVQIDIDDKGKVVVRNLASQPALAGV